MPARVVELVLRVFTELAEAVEEDDEVVDAVEAEVEGRRVEVVDEVEWDALVGAAVGSVEVVLVTEVDAALLQASISFGRLLDQAERTAHLDVAEVDDVERDDGDVAATKISSCAPS